MNDKEKQIEEIANYLYAITIYDKQRCLEIARYILDLGYFKVEQCLVLLSMDKFEEYQRNKYKSNFRIDEIKEQAVCEYKAKVKRQLSAVLDAIG